jgi:hypothetical protein
VRAFLAAVVRKKLGLRLESEKTDGERVYGNKRKDFRYAKKARPKPLGRASRLFRQSLAAANVVYRLRLCSGDFLPPSPPAEKATGRQDQTGQASTGDGARDCGGGGRYVKELGGSPDLPVRSWFP